MASTSTSTTAPSTATSSACARSSSRATTTSTRSRRSTASAIATRNNRPDNGASGIRRRSVQALCAASFSGTRPLFLLPLESADPLALLAAVARDPVAMLLDSAARDEERGRYSFLAVEPFALLTADESGTRLAGERPEQDPFTALQALLARRALPSQPGAPFQGGAVGWRASAGGRCLDRRRPPQPDAARRPDPGAGLFDLVVGFDWRAGTRWIASSGLPAPEGPARKARARARAEALRERLAAAAPL